MKLRDENRGMILMAAHVGCWQVAMSALDFLERPVNMLMRQDAGDIDRHYFEHAGIECPYRTIDPTGYLGGTLEMMGALKQEQIVSVMGDRLLGSDRSSIAIKFWAKMSICRSALIKLHQLRGHRSLSFYQQGRADQLQPEAGQGYPSTGAAGSQGRDIPPLCGRVRRSARRLLSRTPVSVFNFFDLWSKPQQQPQPQNNRDYKEQ